MGRVDAITFAALLIFFQHFAHGKAPQGRKATVHTVITTECSPYFDWQILGLVYSFKRAKQPGGFTRLLSCTEEQLKNYRGLDLVPTHVVPSLTMDPNKEHNDHYSAYNKPGAVLFWLRGGLCRRTLGYLKGVKNELALKHVPQILPRNDTLAGPMGRRGDQVGGFCIMHKEDLKRVAPLWLKFSKAVRHDPEAWNLTGDAFTHHPGEKPWISEMYGYSFGTAAANVWHHVDYEAMLYPGYTTYVPPKVLHYGLHWEVGKTGYEFDKHWFYDFDALQCPPWNLTGNSKGGLFRHPPHPATYPTKGFDLLVDMLAVEPMVVLNAAFCELHRKRCRPSEQLLRECSYAEQLMRDFDSIAAGLQANLTSKGCLDKDDRCPKWAGNGECLSNPSWMKTNCRLSCQSCKPSPPPAQVAQGLEGRLRGIGSLLGLGGEGRWPQQKAIVSDMATADAMFIDGMGSGQGHQLLLGGERRMVGRADVTSDVASFLHRLGWVGLLLWCGTAALFLTFLPSRRLRRSLLRNGAGTAGVGSGSLPRPGTPGSVQKVRRSAH